MLIIDKNSSNSYKNRGLSLEDRINETLNNYKNNNLALIYKKPTPIKIINYDNKENLITKACFLSKSTTDYNGIYKGKYIDFEAKSTKSKTSFPLKNIETHQIEHLKTVNKMGGVAFFIIEFSSINEIYLLTIEQFLNYIKENNKESIPLKYFKKDAYLIEKTLKYPIHFLSVLEKIV